MQNINEQVTLQSVRISELKIDTERNEEKQAELLEREKKVEEIEKEMNVCIVMVFFGCSRIHHTKTIMGCHDVSCVLLFTILRLMYCHVM